MSSTKINLKNPLYTKSDVRRFVEENKPKQDAPFRSESRKDFGRIIHCPAFRRLQGKTQLFPNHENDFYRNRLTHSLEVAQIAKSIAMMINHKFLPADQPIDLNIVELAALAHDIGHPPFGHNGEMALDLEMRDEFGGFEGNAQTFRILSRLEKKVTVIRADNGDFLPVIDGQDNRAGLNLTARSLAAVLKYDRKIPDRNADRKDRQNKLCKGYYSCDEEVVNFVKKSVLDTNHQKFIDLKIDFKTLECQIMDVADDIAYSTYDLEDAFKADFLNPMKIMAFDSSLYEEIAQEIEDDLQSDTYKGKFSDEELKFNASNVLETLSSHFKQIFDIESTIPWSIAAQAQYRSNDLATDGYLRTDFTSDLVGLFISGVIFEPNQEFPALSKVYLQPSTFKIVETLKKISYKSLILSPMLKMAEFRGQDMLSDIYEILTDDGGPQLMPKDFGKLFKEMGTDIGKHRVVCDYISGMTDRYALEFYNRLVGSDPETIHKPH